MDGMNLTISASVASAIIGALATYWRTKQPVQAELKQPLDITITDKFATREQLTKFEDRLNSFATKDEIETLRHEMNNIHSQLTANDERDDSRIRGVHKRIDELMKVMLDCNKKR